MKHYKPLHVQLDFGDVLIAHLVYFSANFLILTEGTAERPDITCSHIFASTVVLRNSSIKAIRRFTAIKNHEEASPNTCTCSSYSCEADLSCVLLIA